jgi:hypothetical protein
VRTTVSHYAGTIMKTRRTALSMLAAVPAAAAAPSSAPAQANARAYTVPYTSVIPMQSRINQVRYLLYVRMPIGYEHGSDRYPLVLTLDADYSFSICANHLEHLSQRRNQAPNAILVSIPIWIAIILNGHGTIAQSLSPKLVPTRHSSTYQAEGRTFIG